jgi:hypothetical protein
VTSTASALPATPSATYSLHHHLGGSTSTPPYQEQKRLKGKLKRVQIILGPALYINPSALVLLYCVIYFV